MNQEKGDNTMSKKIYVKPSKSNSKFAFFVGLGFCLFGIFVAIPIFKLFGVVWTLVAVGITYSHWKNAFTDSGQPTRVIEIEDTNSMVQSQQNFSFHSVEERLKSLQNLYEQRLITKEEYDQKKQEILKEL